MEEIIQLLSREVLYAESDRSEKDGVGSYAYGLTSGRGIEKVWE